MRWRQGKALWDHGRHTQEPLRHDPFFDTIERTDIDNLLLYVDRRTDFMAAFEHVLGRYQRGKAVKPITVACLMAYATNIGLGRMAEISNLTYQQLSTTTANFIRLETLREANERIANATARLPIFRHFDIGEAVHSSSDGQKFEAAIPTINARHSAKYFGLKKGVVAYTLLASHVPLNARIIGANEHEQNVWNECARLIANAVVYYNSLILSEVLGALESQQALASVEDLKRISPLAWQHINFYGHYQFDSDTPPVDIAEIGRRLAFHKLDTASKIQAH